MDWMTSRPALAARSLVRAVDAVLPLRRRRGGKRPEDRFGAWMLSQVAPGDTVWDVGAHIGRFAQRMAKRAGPTGRVFAFEPNPENARICGKNLESVPTAVLLPVALGDRVTSGRLQGKHGTTRVLDAQPDDASTAVTVLTGDSAIANGDAAPPNVIKIDTEGRELDVLVGMKGLLRSTELRAVGVEVHFRLLSAAGLDHVPGEIVALLRSSGFTTKWVDSSHVVALRGSA
jgi:FkbM family methyltransferase